MVSKLVGVPGTWLHLHSACWSLMISSNGGGLSATTVQGIPDVVIVGEASDGPEAIEKAAQLRPDLVLLDIGLPLMNGIEVAREIGKISPESSIFF